MRESRSEEAGSSTVARRPELSTTSPCTVEIDFPLQYYQYRARNIHVGRLSNPDTLEYHSPLHSQSVQRLRGNVVFTVPAIPYSLNDRSVIDRLALLGMELVLFGIAVLFIDNGRTVHAGGW